MTPPTSVVEPGHAGPSLNAPDITCGAGVMRACRRMHPGTSIYLVVLPLFRCAPQLEVRAVGAPRSRIEARRPRNRQDIPMTAAFGSVLGWTAPAARAELHHGFRHRRRRGGVSHGWCWRGHVFNWRGRSCGAVQIVVIEARVQRISPRREGRATPQGPRGSRPCRSHDPVRCGPLDARRLQGYRAPQSSRRA